MASCGPAVLLGVAGLFVPSGGGAGQPPDVLPLETPADAAYYPPENYRELLALDEPMRRFFSSRVDQNCSDEKRLDAIVAAILHPEGLGFAYEVEGAYDAREVFRRRRGNCQGFSFLVLAVAREYGLQVQFQDIPTFQRWDRFDRFIATVRHTNVRMTFGLEERIVDLRPDNGRPLYASNRYVVSDKRAFAQFYSTVGFFRLVRGDCHGALRLMKLATETDPDCAMVWSNLGNLYVRLDELAAARECFEKSLRLDGRSEAALDGLVNVLRRLGGPAELKLAAKYERCVRDYHDRNPYYAYHLAGQARVRGDAKEVEERLRRAIRLKGDEPLFYEELIALLRQTGREREAHRAEIKLAKIRDQLAKVETYIVPGRGPANELR
jgi:tetratricopeptide (TPR) repeat protein